jgi:hypothetical protein
MTSSRLTRASAISSSGQGAARCDGSSLEGIRSVWPVANGPAVRSDCNGSHGSAGQLVFHESAQQSWFGPGQVVSGLARAGFRSRVLKVSSRYRSHTVKHEPEFHSSSCDRQRHVKTRKDTSENLIFWGIPLRPCDLGF